MHLTRGAPEQVAGNQAQNAKQNGSFPAYSAKARWSKTLQIKQSEREGYGEWPDGEDMLFRSHPEMQDGAEESKGSGDA